MRLALCLRYGRFVFILLMPVLLGCSPRSTPSVEPSKIVYPQWFWSPPTALPFPTAVGYSTITLVHPEEAKAAAIDNGIKQLTKSIKLRIHGEQSSIDGKFNLRFTEETDPQIEEGLKETHHILATYEDRWLTMVLVGLEAAPHVDTRVTEASVTHPQWIERLPRQSGYLYAHGQSLMKSHRPQKAWQNAEYHARVTLVQSIRSHIDHLQKTGKGRINQVTVSQTDITLSGIETVARWYDAQNHTCHVLVRVPRSVY